jgi:hypothetical protein
MLIETLNEGPMARVPKGAGTGCLSRGLSSHRIGSVPSFRIARYGS